jgi:hypothetical protein
VPKLMCYNKMLGSRSEKRRSGTLYLGTIVLDCNLMISVHILSFKQVFQSPFNVDQ